MEARAAAQGRRLQVEIEGAGVPRRVTRGNRAPGAFPPVQRRMGKVEIIESRDKALEQQSVARLARAAGKDPLDWMLDLALSEDLDTVFNALLLNSDEAAVARMLRHPASLVSLSDAGAHLTFFNDAGFGLHLLGHWVRERGELTLADAVWRLTGQPAKLFGIRGRGVLRPGYQADLLLFDPASVSRGPRRRVFDLPGGNPRLTTEPIGVHGVWVNGVRIVGPAGPLEVGKLPGRLLREFVN
ncbi:MAG TPA: amidohydrolase family protein [Burkholderiales bacterium]